MAIILDHVSYIYDSDTKVSHAALKDVSVQIPDGQFIGLIGHTGSGKSTLIQHLNGLLQPPSGSVFYNGKDISDPDFDRRKLRSKVGLVFQYPEHQLFEETVFKDVCFGPKLSAWRMNIFINPHLICREDRSEGWRSPACLP